MEILQDMLKARYDREKEAIDKVNNAQEELDQAKRELEEAHKHTEEVKAAILYVGKRKDLDWAILTAKLRDWDNED